MPLPPSLLSLLEPGAYPHPVKAVQCVQTHISWILLTGDFAYKIKRPVHFPFVDLRCARHRAWLCEQEVILNRRFAPQVYIGVCRITSDPGGARVEGSGPVIEHAVKMRQFDRSQELDSLLQADAIEPAELEAFGARLARIHAALPIADQQSDWGRAEAIRTAIARNFEECAAAARVFGDPEELRKVQLSAMSEVDSVMPVMRARRAAGKVRECHGDLHCGNVVRLDSDLTAFDCLEFEPAFRWIDVADEVAFLRMDLESLDRRSHAIAFLRGYFSAGGDWQACELFPAYSAHRALVRAKVAALSVEGTESVAATRPRYARYLRTAQQVLSRRRCMLILMSGFSGSGKTWLARQLAPAVDALHVRSDVERKRLAGLAADERSGSEPGQGIYSAQTTQSLNRYLVSAAASVLKGGFTVIVDATFNRRVDRDRFASLARDLGLPAAIVHCYAPDDVLRSRISNRQEEGTDASEADLAVLDWQQKHHDPLQIDEALTVIDASTIDPHVLASVVRRLESLRAE